MRFLNYLVLSAALLSVANCIIPPACTGNMTKPDAMCCPIPANHTTPCGFPSRGICRHVQVFKTNGDSKYDYWNEHDFRVGWPSRLFKFACECVGEFNGMDCGDCWFGYTGKNCEKRTRHVRKNALKQTKKEKTNFWKVLVKSKRTKSPFVIPTIYEDWTIGAPFRTATIHEEIMFRYWFARFSIVSDNRQQCASRSGENGVDFVAGQPINPLFHRTFLMYWEHRLRTLAKKTLKISDFSFPYWDFTDAKHCEVCRNDLVCEEMKYLDLGTNTFFLHYDCPYASWGAHCSTRYRKTNCSYCGKDLILDALTRRWVSNDFPTTADVKRILKAPLFYTDDKCQSLSYLLTSGKGCFCDKNKVTMMAKLKSMVRGTFAISKIAPNDPLFIMVYANIDRLMSRWQEKMLPSSRELPTFWGTEPGACRWCTFVSFTPAITLEDILVNTRMLGYKYDNMDFGKLSEKTVIAKIGQPDYVLTCKKSKKVADES